MDLVENQVIQDKNQPHRGFTQPWEEVRPDRDVQPQSIGSIGGHCQEQGKGWKGRHTLSQGLPSMA